MKNMLRYMLVGIILLATKLGKLSAKTKYHVLKFFATMCSSLCGNFRNCFEIFVRWFEMDFRGGFDCYLSKFSKLNVEKNNRKRPKRRSKHEQRTQYKTISVKFQNSFLAKYGRCWVTFYSFLIFVEAWTISPALVTPSTTIE